MPDTKKTTIPVGAKRPQDHLAAEAKGEVVETTFEFRGTEYTVRNDALDDLDVMEAIEDERYIRAARAILGAEQFGRLKAQMRAEAEDGRARMSTDFKDFLEALFESVDFTL